MTPLDEIQARADAATAGPWRLGGSGIIAVAGVEYITSCVRTDPDAEFIAHAREDVPKLVAALRAVEGVHREAPVYDTWAEDCGHDDCDGVETSDGEIYCPRSVGAYTCEHCADLARDNENGELPDWPCQTIAAIRKALG